MKPKAIGCGKALAQGQRTSPGAIVAQDRNSPPPPLDMRVRAIASEVARAQMLADRAFADRRDGLGAAPRAFRIAETTVSFDLGADDLHHVSGLSGLSPLFGLVLTTRIGLDAPGQPPRLTLLLTPTLPED